jgi:hypothetical protein
MAPWACALYAADFQFWRVYWPEIQRGFRGECWTVSEQARSKFGLYWIQHAPDEGLARGPDRINGGGNSGYQAIGLAALFGAARIILLGYDMQQTGGRVHWHGRHAGGLHNGTHYSRWLPRFAPLALDLAAAGVEVVNCTRETALRAFPRAELRDVLA